MTTKQRKLVRICLIILALSMLTMAISTFIQIQHNGWESVNTINTVPFGGMVVVLIIMLKRDDKEKAKEKEKDE